MVTKVKEESKLTREFENLRGQSELLVSEPIQGWSEKVVYINRCAKVVKGGRRFSFGVLVVAGNKNGLIGIGQGKSKEVSDAIRKANGNAKKRIFQVSLLNATIPHVTIGCADGGRVILKPACPGTGVIAGGGVRAVLEMIGVKDVLSKSLGSNNHFAMVRATLDALLKLRTKEQVMALKSADVNQGSV
jgi:small subunit ribosomal protein S5